MGNRPFRPTIQTLCQSNRGFRGSNRGFGGSNQGFRAAIRLLCQANRVLLSLFDKLEGTAATRQFNSMKDDIHNGYVRGTEMQRDIFQEQHRGKPL